MDERENRLGGIEGMLARTRLNWAVAIAAVAIAASPAIAQTGGARQDAQVDVRRPVNLSPADQVREADTILQRMDMARSGIRRQLETARAQRDVVKTLCLNDKLNQVDVAKRSAQERASALKSAVQRNDADLGNHEFTILKVLQQRSEQLTAEANSCVGQEEAFVGVSKVTQTVDQNLPPPSNETEFPQSDPTLVTEVPKCTSCTR
jgi:hypothetical protein